MANFCLLRVNLIFENHQKAESDVGTNIFVIVGATSEMRCDHHIIIFMDLSDKLGLEPVPIETFPVFLSNETIVGDMLLTQMYLLYIFLKSLILVCTTNC